MIRNGTKATDGIEKIALTTGSNIWNAVSLRPIRNPSGTATANANTNPMIMC